MSPDTAMVRNRAVMAQSGEKWDAGGRGGRPGLVQLKLEQDDDSLRDEGPAAKIHADNP